MKGPASQKLATFYVGASLFGIDVMQVQEVTGPSRVVRVPLAPKFVRGLINLRGQIATALGLRELFAIDPGPRDGEMSVVCRIEGNLVSLIVDSIGDVLELESSLFEKAPDTIPGGASGLKRFVKGIYKMNGTLLSVVDLEAIALELTPKADAA